MKQVEHLRLDLSLGQPLRGFSMKQARWFDGFFNDVFHDV